MHVYWWHVGELRAVKLGHADDPRQRVSEYRSAYGLSGDDVRGYELGGGVDPEWVESQLYRMLEAQGLRRIALRLRDAGEEEFFALGGRTFDDAHALLIDATRHIAFAEVSNQRKQQRRHEREAAQVPAAPPPQAPETIRAHDEPRPSAQAVPPPSPPPAQSPAPARLGLYLVGAIAALGVVAGMATLMAHKNPSVATAEDIPCTIADLGNSLVHVTCSGSWVLLRWDGKWTFDRGENERAALDFFNASDIARTRGGFPSRASSPPLPQQAEVKPEPSPPANPPTSRAAPPPPRPAAPLPQQAEAKPEPPPAANPPASRVAPPPPRPTAPLPQRAEAKPEPSPPTNPPASRTAPPPRPTAPLPQQAEAKPEPSPPTNPPASRAAPPPPRPTAPLPQQAEAKPEPPPQPDDARVAPPPPVRHAAPRPATVPPQPWQEPPPSRARCAVSRPKPGFQVYLVTCPNSQATIGRTVESTTAWTVSESVNGTEAIDFFMRSPYAR